MKLDRISGVFLFLPGSVVILKSLSYPLGNFRKPASGLLPLIASLLVIGLSALSTIPTFLMARF